MWRSLRRRGQAAAPQAVAPPLPFFGPLPELARRGEPILYAFSPSVLPQPADWRPDIHVVGFSYLGPPAGWQPSPELVKFLDAGPPPVFIGFGSMPSYKPGEMTALLVQAVERTGHRAILQRGEAELGEGQTLPQSIFLAGEVPHSWLFSRVSAVMHHGGAGTTGGVSRRRSADHRAAHAGSAVLGPAGLRLGGQPEAVPRQANLGQPRRRGDSGRDDRSRDAAASGPDRRRDSRRGRRRADRAALRRVRRPLSVAPQKTPSYESSSRGG